MRPRYAAGVCASVLLVPALFLRADADPKHAFEVSAGPQLTGSTWLAPSRIIDEAPTVASTPTTAAIRRAVTTTRPAAVTTTPTTPTTAAPVAVTSTTRLAAAPPTTARPAPPSTLSLRPTPTPATAPRAVVTLPPVLTPVSPAYKAVSGLSESGKASWFHAADATCAHRTLPFGTLVKVTHTSTGGWTTCEVNDWGPADTSRIIDLSYDTFEQLASASAGLIDVIIEW